MKNVYFFAVCILIFSCIGSAVQAASAPVIGPPVVQNGLRFETWLVSPKIIMPDKSVSYEKQKPMVLFSVRVTNLTQTPLRINPYFLSLTLIGPDGKEVFPDPLVIHGDIRQPQEADYILLPPGQSQVLPKSTGFFWRGNHLCLAWPSNINDHPFVYEGVRLSHSITDLLSSPHAGLTAGTYHFSMRYNIRAQTVPIRISVVSVKTLIGFWIGDVSLPPLTFQLVTHP